MRPLLVGRSSKSPRVFLNTFGQWWYRKSGIILRRESSLNRVHLTGKRPRPGGGKDLADEMTSETICVCGKVGYLIMGGTRPRIYYIPLFGRSLINYQMTLFWGGDPHRSLASPLTSLAGGATVVVKQMDCAALINHLGARMLLVGDDGNFVLYVEDANVTSVPKFTLKEYRYEMDATPAFEFACHVQRVLNAQFVIYSHTSVDMIPWYIDYRTYNTSKAYRIDRAKILRTTCMYVRICITYMCGLIHR